MVLGAARSGRLPVTQFKQEGSNLFRTANMDKKCLKCEIEKDLSLFYKSKNQKQGVQDYCKECKKKIDADVYLKQKAVVTKIKIDKGGKCLKCNENRLHVLEFHHLDPKIKKIIFIS